VDSPKTDLAERIMAALTTVGHDVADHRAGDDAIPRHARQAES